MKTFLCHILVIVTLIFVGCSDQCEDDACGPGTCDDGICICPDGYEGSSCETLENEKYFGMYNVSQINCDFGSMFGVDFIQIDAKSSGGPFDVTISTDGVNSFNGTLEGGRLQSTIDINGLPVTIDGFYRDANNFGGVMSGGVILFCDFTMSK